MSWANYEWPSESWRKGAWHALHRSNAIQTGPCGGLLSANSVSLAEAGLNVWTSNGPAGESIHALAIDPTRPSTLCAGSMCVMRDLPGARRRGESPTESPRTMPCRNEGTRPGTPLGSGSSLDRGGATTLAGT